MKELPDFISAELKQIEVPISRVVRLLSEPSWDADQTTAFGTYLQNIYGGIERILQFLLKARGENVPKSPTWHYDLLKLSFACGLTPPETRLPLENLMKFRHRHIHGYGHMSDEAKLRELAAPIPEMFARFAEHIEKLFA
jgi:uncharacterized protein YutE (UPF0331/DUF86 family)